MKPIKKHEINIFARTNEIDIDLLSVGLAKRDNQFIVSGWRFINEFTIDDLLCDEFYNETRLFFERVEDVYNDDEQWSLLPLAFQEDCDNWQNGYYYGDNGKISIENHLRNKSVEDVATAVYHLIKLLGYETMLGVFKLRVIMTEKDAYFCYKI